MPSRACQKAWDSVGKPGFYASHIDNYLCLFSTMTTHFRNPRRPHKMWWVVLSLLRADERQNHPEMPMTQPEDIDESKRFPCTRFFRCPLIYILILSSHFWEQRCTQAPGTGSGCIPSARQWKKRHLSSMDFCWFDSSEGSHGWWHVPCLHSRNERNRLPFHPLQLLMIGSQNERCCKSKRCIIYSCKFIIFLLEHILESQ